MTFADDARARFAVGERRDDIDDFIERSTRDIKTAADIGSRHALLAGGIEGLHDVDGARESLLTGEFTRGHAHAPSFR